MKMLKDLVSSPRFCESLNEGSLGMGIRRQAREIALQALFMIDFNDDWSAYQAGDFHKLFSSEDRGHKFADLLIEGVIEHKNKLDSIITRASENWSLQRMARVDRALMRISCFELCCLPDVPRNVSINEAIEIAKRFGAEDSPMFINGVLDKIATYIDKVEVAEPDEFTLLPQKVRA